MSWHMTEQPQTRTEVGTIRVTCKPERYILSGSPTRSQPTGNIPVVTQNQSTRNIPVVILNQATENIPVLTRNRSTGTRAQRETVRNYSHCLCSLITDVPCRLAFHAYRTWPATRGQQQHGYILSMDNIQASRDTP